MVKKSKQSQVKQWRILWKTFYLFFKRMDPKEAMSRGIIYDSTWGFGVPKGLFVDVGFTGAL